jgi:hypothetical protein
VISIPKLFSTILILSYFFLIGLCLQGVVLAGTIQLPQTGQTTCYSQYGLPIPCSGTGQDGEKKAGVAWPNPRFSVSGDCVTDNLTGLMWARNANLPNDWKTWSGALDYVASLNSSSGLCGYKDWRLPNVNELESLVNAEKPQSAAWLNSQGFTNVQVDYYWSSSTNVLYNDYAWVVYMYDGDVNSYYKKSYNYVWPVRSGQSGSMGNSIIWRTGQTIQYYPGDDGALQKGMAWPAPRFTDNGNQTVTDDMTGLMWSKNAMTPGPLQCNPGVKKIWQEALDFVKCLNTSQYLGYRDWRVPNRKELYSLVDFSEYYPSIQVGHPFINVQTFDFWQTSTSQSRTSYYAWVVYMWGGFVNSSVKKVFPDTDNFGYVWPVRGGRVGPILNAMPWLLLLLGD